MPLDGITTAAIQSELHQALANARIMKITQPDDDTIILQCRQPGYNLKLLLSCRRDAPRVHLTQLSPANPMQPPVFCMVLRKHLEPARILRVEQPGLDRVLRIVLEGIDTGGHRVERLLIAELMGHQSNLILVEAGSGAILDAARRSTPGSGTGRCMAPGHPYAPPPPPEKRDPLQETRDEFARTIRLAPAGKSLGRWLADRYHGLGPAAGRQILAQAGLHPRTTREELDSQADERLWQTFHHLFAAVKARAFRPSLTLDEQGNPVDFWAFPLHDTPTTTQRPAASISQALETYHHRHLEEKGLQVLRDKLLKITGTAQKKARRKLARQQEDLDRAQQATRYKLYGDLLTANLYHLRQGQSQVELPDYFSAERDPVQIALDSRRTPAENAQAYYKLYSKLKHAQTIVAKQMRKTKAELRYLDQVAGSVEWTDSQAALREIEGELQAEGYLKRPDTRRRQREDQPLPPLTGRTSDGWEILVGRNNRQNDRLTLRTASGDDVWLHTKDIPGSHVILRTRGAQPSPEALEEAALLAAYFSKARASSNVPVDYTLRRHVRKPAGAKPGMVIYTDHRTLYITPDKEQADRLLTRDKRASDGPA